MPYTGRNDKKYGLDAKKTSMHVQKKSGEPMKKLPEKFKATEMAYVNLRNNGQK